MSTPKASPKASGNSAEPGTYPSEDERNVNADHIEDHTGNQPDNEVANADDGATSSGSSSEAVKAAVKKPAKGDKKRKKTNEEEEEAKAEHEREEVARLEARLPRPEWYSSDSDDVSQLTEPDEEEISEMTVTAEGSLSLLIIYTVFTFVCFAFNLTASCPIPWMRGRGTVSGRQYGVWRATGGGQPVFKVNNIHDCAQEMQMWQTSAAFSVMATLPAFGAFLSGILLCCGVGHVGASAILSFYSMSFSLVSWGVVAHLFGYNCCNKYRYRDIARLDAGFALTLISFVFMLCALVVLGVYFIKYYTKSIHAGVTRPMSFAYLALLIVVALFYCVGNAFTMWEKDFDLIKCKVTMWHIELYDKQTTLSTFLGRKEYQCSTFTRRMKVVAAFNIMALIWLTMGILFSVGACFNAGSRTPSVVLGFVSCLFALVGWIVLCVIRHSHLCTSPVPPGVSIWTDLGYNGVPSGYFNGQIEYSGYKMSEGFALLLTGWGLNLIAPILNCVLA